MFRRRSAILRRLGRAICVLAGLLMAVPPVRAALVGLAFVMAAGAAVGQGWNVEVVGQIGGVCYAVYVEGNYAYIGEGVNLTILDVSNPTSPVVRSRTRLPDFVSGVSVSGGLAYVADAYNGLQIIDVSNPAAPTLRGSL